MNFAGKVVLITGASSGIGAAAALQFAKLGASVVLAGRNVNNLKKIASECQQCQPPADTPTPHIVTGELTNEADTQAILDGALKHFGGRLDVLVNNAGGIVTGSIENTTMEQYDNMMGVNMRSVYHLTQLAVPHLIKTQGTIVNVSSVNGIRSFPGVLAYCTAKAALDQFTRCTALELAAKNVRVNSVNPGVTITNLHKRGGMDEDTYQNFLKRCKDTHAMGRPGQPEEIANAIVWLASSQASFITGVTLPVDGGRHAMCPR